MQMFSLAQGKRLLGSLSLLAILGTASALPSFMSPVVAQADANYLVLSTYAAAPQSSFTAQGFGFGANEQVKVTSDGASVTATADGNGNFTSPGIQIPFWAAGSYPVTAMGVSSGRTQSQNIYVSGFYPTAAFSPYYVLPNESFGLSGQHFAPNEQVQLKRGDQLVATFTADGNGGFSASKVATIPFSAANSAWSYTLNGLTSGMNIPLTLSIGQFYPQISPSSYYIGKNQSFSVSGNNFAANEPVDLYVAGAKVQTANADTSGNVNFGGAVSPSDGGNFEVRAMGTLSGQSSGRTVTLAQ
ncbi:MAG: hypothetical protein JWM56_101 [Candidatus Peribacteria bacterium]|nr:hypothetical protein [Candidatus Peribacteria bacterium]